MSDCREPASSNDPAPAPSAASDEKASKHSEHSNDAPSVADEAAALPREYGGRKGPEPVRYGDWEKSGRCIDF